MNIEILRKYVKLTCKFVRKIEIRQSEKISILYDIQDVTEDEFGEWSKSPYLTYGKVIVTALQTSESQGGSFCNLYTRLRWTIKLSLIMIKPENCKINWNCLITVWK